MRALLAFFSWRHARRRPLRVLLGAVAIALGVSLVVSMAVANTTVERAFERTAGDLAGKAEWQVTRAGGLGVDAAALERLRDLPGATFAPVVQRSLSVDGVTLLVLGVDFGRDSPLRMYRFEGAERDVAAVAGAALRPGSLVVTRAFAERRGLRAGSRLLAEGAARGAPSSWWGACWRRRARRRSSAATSRSWSSARRRRSSACRAASTASTWPGRRGRPSRPRSGRSTRSCPWPAAAPRSRRRCCASARWRPSPPSR